MDGKSEDTCSGQAVCNLLVRFWRLIQGKADTLIVVLLMLRFPSIREGLREKVQDALLRARRPPMTFTGLLIFLASSRAGSPLPLCSFTPSIQPSITGLFRYY